MIEKSDPKFARAVADAEHQLNTLVEAVTDYAIYMMDADGKVTTWNPGAERIKGVYRGRDYREGFFGLLYRCRQARGTAFGCPSNRRPRGPIRGRGLARSQGWE